MLCHVLNEFENCLTYTDVGTKAEGISGIDGLIWRMNPNKNKCNRGPAEQSQNSNISTNPHKNPIQKDDTDVGSGLGNVK